MGYWFIYGWDRRRGVSGSCGAPSYHGELGEKDFAKDFDPRSGQAVILIGARIVSLGFDIPTLNVQHGVTQLAVPVLQNANLTASEEQRADVFGVLLHLFSGSVGQINLVHFVIRGVLGRYFPLTSGVDTNPSGFAILIFTFFHLFIFSPLKIGLPTKRNGLGMRSSQPMSLPKNVSKYLSSIGAQGGSAKTEAKRQAAKLNGLKPCANGKKRGRPPNPLKSPAIPIPKPIP